MSERPPHLQIVARRGQQLRCVNEKIAALASARPWSDVYAAFIIGARLATEGIEAATGLQQMPGASAEEIQPTLEFWYHVRDYSYAAALAVAGGNQTLAEAFVTFRLLQGLASEVRDDA